MKTTLNSMDSHEWEIFDLDKVNQVPEKPGTYALGFARPYGDVEVAYVGMSASLRRRLKDQYRRDRFSTIDRFRFEVTSSRREAAREERRIIASLKEIPQMNNRGEARLIEAFEEQARSAEKNSGGQSSTGVVTIFVSYSHVDRGSLQELMVHLLPVENKGQVRVWTDTTIEAGEKWRDEIDKSLQRSDIAILLVSPHFMASDFIMNEEVPTILDKAHQEGALVLPLIVNHSRFEREESLSQFQAINSPDDPLMAMSEVERAQTLDALAERIETYVDRDARS